MGDVWVFDLDGCIVDSLTGSSLRPGTLELLARLRGSGATMVSGSLTLYSAGDRLATSYLRVHCMFRRFCCRELDWAGLDEGVVDGATSEQRRDGRHGGRDVAVVDDNKDGVVADGADGVDHETVDSLA